MARRATPIAASLAAVATAALFAAPAGALDLTGTVTVHEVSTRSIGGTKDVTTVWRLKGRLLDEGGITVAPAAPDVRAYADRTAYTTADGEPVCSYRTFDGWTPGDQNPVTQDLMLDLRAQNRLTRRSAGFLTFLGTGPSARMSSASCGAPALAIDAGTLMGTDNQGSGGAYSRALMGVGNLANSSPQRYLAPGRIVFRLVGGRWRADGVRTRTGSYVAGLEGAGTRRVRVEWHLRSRVLSRQCAIPPRSRVRGRTVAQVTRLLRRAGLRPGVRLADESSPAPRGRVVGLVTIGFTDLRCGSRVSLLVSR